MFNRLWIASLACVAVTLSGAAAHAKKAPPRKKTPSPPARGEAPAREAAGSQATDTSTGDASGAKEQKRDPKRSGVHHKKAEAYFRAKRYKEAAQEFLKAYSFDPRVAFLYLAGDAFQRAGALKEAVANYEAYLKKGSNEDRKKKVQEKLPKLKEALAAKPSPRGDPRETTKNPRSRDSATPRDTEARNQASAESDNKPRPREASLSPRAAARGAVKAPKNNGKETQKKSKKSSKQRKRSMMELTAWALVGSAAVLLTVTGVFALKVEDSEDNMRRLATSVDPNDNLRVPYEGNYKKDYERYKKDGELYEKLSWTFAGLSAAAVVGSAVLFTMDYLRRRKHRKEKATKKRVHIRPTVSPRGGGVALGLEF